MKADDNGTVRYVRGGVCLQNAKKSSQRVSLQLVLAREGQLAPGQLRAFRSGDATYLERCPLFYPGRHRHSSKAHGLTVEKGATARPAVETKDKDV